MYEIVCVSLFVYECVNLSLGQETVRPGRPGWRGGGVGGGVTV